MSDEATLGVLTEYLEAMEDERRIHVEFIASINRGSTVSDEGKQEASDRLLAARQRSHALYRRLHLAATGREAAWIGREQTERS